MARMESGGQPPSFLLYIFLILSLLISGINSLLAPMFTVKLPSFFEFSNSSGGNMVCAARGDPEPQIQWLTSDDSPVVEIPGLREISPEGMLIFPAFRAEDFRQDVHGVYYRCSASNILGTLVTPPVHVRGVVLHSFDVHVYDVYVIRGNSAIMRCHIPDILRDYVTVTAWIKDSIVFINAAKNDAYSKYILLASGELFIRDVQVTDGMTAFRCQATHRLTGESKLSTTAGRLIVTEPKGNIVPKIVFSTAEVYSSLDEMVFLPCVAQANPLSQYRWTKQTMVGYEIPVEIGKRFVDVSGSLLIKHIELADSGIYSCNASNSIGTDKINVDVKIRVPLNVQVTPQTLSVDVGSSATFHCKVLGAPLTSIIWLRNGHRLPTIGISQPDNHTLHINKMTPALSGIYQCFAFNAESSVYSVGVLQQADSIPEIVKSFDSKLLKPGEGLVIECLAKGNPLPNFVWTLDNQNKPLEANEHMMIETVKDVPGHVLGRLSVKKARTEDGGLYTCIAKNNAGSDKHTQRINVYGKLMVRPHTRTVAVEEETVRVDCPFYGYPYDVINWEKNGASLPVHLRQVPFSNGTLVLRNIQQKSDFGTYTCIVKSQDGASVRGNVEVDIMVPPKIISFAFQDDQFFKGMRAYIVCAVSQGDKPIEFEWLKDNQPISPSLGVVTRNIDGQANSLSIESVSSIHTGNYTCVASNEAARVTHTAQLLVHVIPRILPFDFRNVTFEGSTARVTCTVDQGDLPIQLRWLKDGHPVSRIKGVLTQFIDEYSSILSIHNVQNKHSGNYTCVASNAAGTVSYTTTLSVNVPPKVVPFTFQDEHLLEGMSVRVSCVVSRGDLPLRIAWQKNKQMVSPHSSISIRNFDEYSSVLSIEPVSPHHSGNYTCTATNHAGVSSHTASLLVKVPSKWLVEPHDIIVQAGKKLLINCQAEGFPKPTIAWKKARGFNFAEENMIPVMNNELTEILSNGTLLFRNIQPEDESFYYCVASNGIGEPLSKAISVKVQAPPKFGTAFQNLLIKKGDEAQILCQAEGDTPISYTWVLNNEIIGSFTDQRFTIKSPVSQESPKGSLSELLISPVDEKDSTTFVCKAENGIGKDEMHVNIIVQETPEASILDTPTNVTNHSLILRWNTPNNRNSPILKYYIQYKKENDKWNNKTAITAVSNEMNEVKVNDLHPASKYHFRIMAENSVGNGSFSETVTAKTDESVPSGAPQRLEVEATDANTLRVSWRPPKKHTWNGIIRGYYIGYKIENGPEDYSFANLEVPEDYVEELIYQLNDLKMYTQYNIIVKAYNSKGAGPFSKPFLAMTSEDVPTKPPESVRCSPLSTRSIYVIWDPPPPEAVNGLLRGYKVLYKPAEEWYDAGIQSKIIQNSKMTLQDLEVNSNYSIEVLAFTKIGDGVKSHPVFCKTHEDVPEPPASIKVVPASSDSVVVAWKATEKSNSAITKYNVYVTPLKDGQQIDQNVPLTEQFYREASVHSTQADAHFVEVSGLKKNRKYAFWVTATSIIGESPPSAIIAETVADSEVGARAASFDSVIVTPWKRDILLPCRAVGMPQPYREWWFSGDPFVETDRVLVRPDGSLFISEIMKEDNGNYTCSVYNEHGKDEVKYSVNVLVPPAPPNVEVVAKSWSTIKLRWKASEDGGDRIRGYFLYYKREHDTWNQKEIRPEYGSFALEGLSCGATYQLYMEAFNSIGAGSPCEILTVVMDGAVIEAPSKDDVIREGTTYITVNLDAWPATACPVQHFGVEYKAVSAKEWTVVGGNIPPSQKKLVISGLSPATWHVMRLLVETNGEAMIIKYKFATLTTLGGTIPPELFETPEPTYIYHMEPMIFIPVVALTIFFTTALIVLLLYFKRRHGSISTGSIISDVSSRLSSWIRRSRPMRPKPPTKPPPSRPHRHRRSGRTSSVSSRQNSEPTPYATSHVSECYTEVAHPARRSNHNRNPSSPWKKQNQPKPSTSAFYTPLNTAPSAPPPPAYEYQKCRQNPALNRCPPSTQETSFPPTLYPAFSASVKSQGPP